MSKKLLIRDLTLRDGQQSLFATRMNQAQVDRVLPFYKSAGFYAMEVWGGAVPDSVMRYLNENPWERLEKIKEAVGSTTKLTALSRGRNLFGYNPYPDQVIEGFNRNAIKSGIDIMRIFDALNDTSNLSSTIRYVRENGGIADGAVCFTVDPKLPPKKKFFGLISQKNTFPPLFTTAYFVQKAKDIEAMGATMITIKDMAGLVSPRATKELIPAFKRELKVPVDFHTHCTPGFGLASVLTSIMYGVDIVDTNIWTFAGGPAAPAFELIYLFCKKMNIDIDVDIDAIAAINNELIHIRRELADYDNTKKFPKLFNPGKDTLPTEIECHFDDAIMAAEVMDEEKLLKACHAIEAHFGFLPPNDKVRLAEIPGGMYTNMLAQLKELGLENLLERVLEVVPEVRLDSGCPPLVTPTSQIVGVQAVNCVIDENKGNPRYTNNNTQFVNLVKGSYGKTPIDVKPSFREKITGSPQEIPYDTSSYKKQANPKFPEMGNHKLAENEKEELLLELFPNVATPYLKAKLEMTYAADYEAERQKKEEEYLKAKLEYQSLSADQKKERLLDGLYNYNWFSYMPSDNELDENTNSDKTKKPSE